MIAIYGLKFIIFGGVLTILLALWAAARDSFLLIITAAIVGLLTIFMLFFYRNPSRQVPDDDNLILAIADGRVLSVEKVDNAYIGGPAWKVSIFLSVLDAHINRIPIDGTIDYVKYNPGKFFPAFKEKASLDNEQTDIGLICKAGRMIFKQIAGIMARRIEYDLNNGQRVDGGRIFGMIHFGSRAELFIPENVRIEVKPGDRVKAGESVIGRIVEGGGN